MTYRRTRLATQIGKIDPKAVAPTVFSDVISTVFDGIDEFVDMGDVAPFRFLRADTFSFSFWCKTSLASQQSAITKSGSSYGDPGYIVQVKSSGKAQVLLTGGSGNQIDVQGEDNTVNDGSWHLVVVTYNGSSVAAGVNIYVDDNLQTKQVNSDTLSSEITNSRAFKAGVKGTSSDDWTGNLDEVAVWNKELTPGDANAVWNSGSPGDLSLHPAAANLVSWWRAGDGDAFPTWSDNQSTNDGTMTNMAPDDFVADTP